MNTQTILDLDQRPPYVLSAILEANGLAELTRQREAEVRAWSAANCPPDPEVLAELRRRGEA